MKSTDRSASPQRRANDMYWTTDAPVRTIAEEVGMSRSAVYGAIEPLGTGVRSPKSDADLVFTNRTNRDQGLGTCPITGVEISLDGAAAVDRDREDRSQDSLRKAVRAPSASAQERIATLDPEKAVMVAGLVGVGVGIGALAMHLLGDRS